MVPLRTLCRVDNHHTMEKCANHKLQIKSIIGAILLVALNCITFLHMQKPERPIRIFVNVVKELA